MPDQTRLTRYVLLDEIVGDVGYKVGNDGSVWSRKYGNWRKLKPGSARGARYVNLRIKGRYRNFYVSRLVLQAFVGPCPEGMEACHWDGNKENNSLSNLRWDTHVNNLADDLRNGTRLLGEQRSWIAKLTEQAVKQIRSYPSMPKKLDEALSGKFGVHWTNIYAARRGKTWAHVK